MSSVSMPKAAAGAKAKADVKAPGTLPVKAVATAAVTPTAPPTRFLERLAAYPVVRQLPASLTSLALESELVKTVLAPVDGIACSSLDITENTGRRIYGWAAPYAETTVSAADSVLGYLENKSATVFPATEGVAVTDEDAVADKDTTPVDDKTATSIVYRATTLTRRVAHGTVDLGKAKVTEVTTKAKALPIVASATAYAAPIVSSASSYVAPIVASTTNYASATVGSATAYVAPIVSSTKTLASTTFTSVTSYAAPVIASTKSYIATGTTLASTYTAPAITSARTYYASVTGNVTQRWTSARAHTTFFATKTQKTAAATYALASGAALNVAERLKDVTGAAGARWSTAKVTVPKALSSLTLADVKHTVLEQSAELYALAHVRLASQYARVQSLMSSVHVPEFVNTLLGRSGVVKLKTQ